jgi:hypothetical protein
VVHLKPRNIIPSEMQRCHIIIICQVWNHEFKNRQWSMKLLWLWTTNICIHD